ncbi:hypothetical protein WJX77_011982 [Trebouxia sp. C0004]
MQAVNSHGGASDAGPVPMTFFESRSQVKVAGLHSLLRNGVDSSTCGGLHATAVVSDGHISKDMGGLLQEDGRDFLFYFVGQKDAVKLQGTFAMKKSLEVIRKVCRAASYMYCGKYEVVEWWPVKQKEQEQKEDVGYYFKLLRLPNQAVLIPQQILFSSQTSLRAKTFCSTRQAYQTVFEGDCSKPVERLASQFISALHSHSGTQKDVLKLYNLCDRCGMDDKAPEVMLCECCKDKGGETCSCRTCIPADELEWLDAAGTHCWRCKHCRQNDLKPVSGTVFEDSAAPSAAAYTTPSGQSAEARNVHMPKTPHGGVTTQPANTGQPHLPGPTVPASTTANATARKRQAATGAAQEGPSVPTTVASQHDVVTGPGGESGVHATTQPAQRRRKVQGSSFSDVIDLDDGTNKADVQARQQQPIGMTDDAPDTAANAIRHCVGPDIRVDAVQQTSSGSADQAAGYSSELVGVSEKAAESIFAMVAKVNSSLSSHQQISSQQAEALQTVAGNVRLLLGLEAVKDNALSDDLNDVLENDAKMDSKQILEVRRFLRVVRQEATATGS